MPKKILFESAVHQFLKAAEYIAEREKLVSAEQYRRWSDFILSLQFGYPRPNLVSVEWTFPRKGKTTFSIDEAQFYTRGDNNESVKSQRESGFLFKEDSIRQKNFEYFQSAVVSVAAEAGLSRKTEDSVKAVDRLQAEELFHDGWASAEDVFKIDVRRMNEACTAPEMRFIRMALGDVKGKTLLDVGSGLGEASVYFALEGADVTATDISQRMLDVAKQLAEKNGTTIKVHKSAAENLALAADQQFDIVYAGNLFHHVDLDPTLMNIKRHLKPNGILASWDPVAYNPVINVYRKKAMKVRTEDEHPLTLGDIKTFRRHFAEVRTRWFWLTTLTIFLLMAFVQRRDPNKERYWKKVIEEADSWSWLYKPLEALDKGLLTVFPFLGPLCWNVVIVARKPKHQHAP